MRMAIVRHIGAVWFVTCLLLEIPTTAQAAQEPFPPASPESQGVNPEVVAQIGTLIQGFVDEGEIVGAELLIIRNRHTILSRGFGWRNQETQDPMEPGTIFNIRSMAKPIVGSVAQRFVDRGLLELDAPVGRYLNSFAEGPSTGITIRQLLTHTSGLPDGNPTGQPSDYLTLRSVADYWGSHGPTASAPGEKFVYSDPGTDVLAVVLEEISRTSLPELAIAEVFQPLGMEDAYAFVDRATSADHRFAAHYQWSQQGTRWLPDWKPGDGSMAPFPIGSGTTWYCTAGDYARLLVAWMEEGRVGRSEWLSTRATERGLAPISAMPYPSRLPGAEVRYGQLWIVYVNEDGERVAFGHSGSDGTYAYAWPEHDLVVLYMTQSRGNRTRLLLEPLFGALADDGP